MQEHGPLFFYWVPFLTCFIYHIRASARKKIKFLGIFQKFIDQSISTNQYTNVLRYKDNIVPLTEIIKEILTANKYGLKTLYYQNFLSIENKDGISDEKQEGCGSGGCVV